MKVATDTWHTLRVDFQETHFTVTFDGKRRSNGTMPPSKTPARPGFEQKPTA